MGRNRPYGEHRERRDDAPAFDDFSDDGDEPFEQALPAAADRSSTDPSPTSPSPDDPSPTDTYSRSSDQPRKMSDSRSATMDFKRSLRGRALAYLSRREHSREELTRKLTPHLSEDDDDTTLPLLLDRLSQEGWLSDARFADSVINRRASRYGPARVIGELKRHNLDKQLVDQLGEALRESEWDRIRAVWARKFGTIAATPQERAKQARFLASRGFSRDLIMRILKVGDDAI